MSKKDELLGGKVESNVQYYDLNPQEILEVASLVALVEQAEAARNYIYSRICQNVADRYEIVDKDITLNFQDIMEKGAKEAKLVVTG